MDARLMTIPFLPVREGQVYSIFGVKRYNESNMSNPVGRPTIYSQELADNICLRISEGESLRAICRDDKMPALSTIMLWNLSNKEFSEHYARAVDARAEHLFEEILEIADDGSNDYMTITKGDEDYNVENREVTTRSKLRVDSRKWFLSKVMPKKFGDKLDVVSDGKAIKGNSIIFTNFKEEE